MRIRSITVAALAMHVAVAEAAAAGTLHVQITGLESTDGSLAVALFSSEADYENQSNPVRRAWLPVTADVLEWTVEDLPAGHYALLAYHDVNGNRQIDFRRLGMPKEPVAVSNDARGIFGPPRFEAARFSIDSGETARQQVRLR